MLNLKPRRKLSCKDTAAFLNIQPKYLRLIENGKHSVPKYLKEKFRQVYNVTDDELELRTHRNVRKKFQCEMCFGYFATTNPRQWICSDCEKPILEAEKKIKKRAEKHAARFKCLKCKVNLPPDRARYCVDHAPQDDSYSMEELYGIYGK